MDLLIVLILLFFVGFLGYLITDFMNHGIRALIHEAQEKAINKLRKRDAVSVDQFIELNKSFAGDKEVFSNLVTGLPKIFRINEGFPFHADEKLSCVFRIDESEIQENKVSWKKAKLKSFIEVYVDELIIVTKETIGTNEFMSRFSSVDNIESEDDIKGFLMEMTFIEYLSFFSKKRDIS
uniref:hypothetical protein n=1 Tax=Ningiella ruwaisensis TaxID=2364274 RepID=UPI00109F9BFB|nr:hypothetical protein [Ningiella ruwaisensis]